MREVRFYGAMKYLGWDPAVPHFEARCDTCGESAHFKVAVGMWTGLPPKPHA